MKESSKSVLRRVHDSRFATRCLIGEGIDIGAGSDPISLYSELFPLMGFVREWDLQDGDAQLLQGVANESFDFVHSSHCLEHLRDPLVALQNWYRVLRPDGHLIFVVPGFSVGIGGITNNRGLLSAPRMLQLFGCVISTRKKFRKDLQWLMIPNLRFTVGKRKKCPPSDVRACACNIHKRFKLVDSY